MPFLRHVSTRSFLLFLSFLFLLSSLSEEVRVENTSPAAPGWCLSDRLQTENRRLYISTLDGDLTALDLKTGQRLWEHHSNIPLYSSTLGYSEPNSEYPNLIPGLDKNLYQWDGNELLKLPYSVDDLIDQSFTSSPGLVRAGARSKDEVVINVANGKPLYKCSQFSCEKYENHSLIGRMDRLLLTSHRTTVREAKSSTGDEICPMEKGQIVSNLYFKTSVQLSVMLEGHLSSSVKKISTPLIRYLNYFYFANSWNFTLSQVSVSLIEGEEEEDENEGEGKRRCLFDDNHSVTAHANTFEGILIIMDRMRGISLDFKFSSPVVSVWYQFGGNLKELQLSPVLTANDQLLRPAWTPGPALMLGSWHQQYYILPITQSTSSPQLSSSSFLSHLETLASTDSWYSTDNNNKLIGNCYNTFLPSLPNTHEGGGGGGPLSVKLNTVNSLTLFKSDHEWLQSLHTEGPNGLALYFYPKLSESKGTEYCLANENSSQETTPIKKNLTTSNYLYTVFSWVSFFVKYGIFALCVLGANKFRRYQMSKRRTHLSSTSSCSSNNDNDDELFEDCESASVSIFDIPSNMTKRRNSSSSTLKPSGTYTLLPTVEEEEVDGSHTMDRLDSSDSSSSITSRFETEYERLGTLGKGGFGVVYHVLNKVDNNEYAIKRIKLPAKKAARDKVMREVHALARFEHRGIVRYFSSWVERAPAGWDQKEEWISISRANSLLQMEEGNQEMSSKLSLKPGYNGTSKHTDSLTFPSFSSRTDSYSELHLPRPQSSNSMSSFTIEFRDDSHSRAHLDSSRQHSGNRSLDMQWQQSRGEDKQIDTCSPNIYLTDVSEAPPTFLFIQMQLCRKESMKDWLRNNIHNRQRGAMLNHFKQVLDAVVYVHNKGMMHRDLKPSNIFFSLDGGVKIGDFGLVTGNVTPDTHRSSHIALKQLAEEVDGVSHTGNIGTHFYISPEQMNGLQYDQKVDVFSLGVILFELNYPFVTDMERVKVLEDLRKNRIPPEFRKHLSTEAKLVEWLMSPVTRRPSSEQVAASDQLRELQQLTEISDFTYIPKL